jgi:hypothetical protein
LAKRKPGLDARDPLIGIGPAKGGFVDDAGRARAAVKRKGGHYEGLAAPLLVALLPLAGPFGIEDGISAFYGSEAVRFDPADPETTELIRRPDGLWSEGDGEVSAVLVGNNLRPWTVAERWPELWLNPAPTHALHSEFGGVPRFERDPDGRLEPKSPAEETLARLFDLPHGWPGADPWAT